MRNLKLPDYIELLLRLMIGGTFIYASISKIFHPDAFALSIFHYRLVPAALLHPFAIYLPYLEFFAGAALIAGKYIKGASLLVSLMVLMFIGAISSALFRDIDISCGCFGTEGGHAIGLQLLFRDFILLAGSIALLFSKISSRQRL
ncbi:MAG: DoxX family membrane protein [bacterium]|nr:DoxX family membrane protein [bacterium]MCP4800073.1 DoxX family membrane protein [bacterium]